MRAHPRARLPVLRRAGPEPAGRAVPGRLAPRGRTRPHPRPGHRGPAMVGRCCAPRPSSPATRPPTAGQDTADFDELIAELDEEITRSGVRGKVAPDQPARRHRSTRRRQDAPDLPRRKVSPRTVGKTYTAPDGKTFRPSMFVTLTCPSYGRVDHRGVPVDPGRLRLRPGRPGRADLRRAVRPVHPEPAPLPRPRRAVLRRRRTPAAAGPAHPHRHPRHHRPRRAAPGPRRHLPPDLVARHTRQVPRRRRAARLGRPGRRVHRPGYRGSAADLG